VPGLVSLLWEVHGDSGRLAWERLFEPALRLAEQGFAVSQRLHDAIAAADDLDRDPTARDLYFHPMPGDETGVEPVAVGHVLTNPAYAHTLRLIAARGPATFYDGDIAEAMVAAVAEHPDNPGLMTQTDLRRFRAKARPPVCLEYRAYEVCGMPPPTSGGLTAAMILGLALFFPIYWLVEEARISRAQEAFFVESYVLVIGALVLTAGALSDRYGRRLGLVLGLVVFGAASAAGAFTPSADLLIAARVAMGAGAAMIMPSTLSIVPAVGMLLGERGQLRIERTTGSNVGRLGLVAQLGRPLLEVPRGCPRRAAGTAASGLDQLGADEQVDTDVLAGRDALLEVVAPRPKTIHPADYREAVAADLFEWQGGTPAVVAVVLHLDLAPVICCLGAETEDDADLVVAVGEGIRLHDELIAHRSLDGEATAVDFGGDPLDDHAPAAVVGHWPHSLFLRDAFRGVPPGAGFPAFLRAGSSRLAVSSSSR
jgi:hypothetical protein